MKKSYDEIKNFDMNLNECRLVLEAIGGLIIVDHEGYIKFFQKIS